MLEIVFPFFLAAIISSCCFLCTKSVPPPRHRSPTFGGGVVGVEALRAAVTRADDHDHVALSGAANHFAKADVHSHMAGGVADVQRAVERGLLRRDLKRKKNKK